MSEEMKFCPKCNKNDLVSLVRDICFHNQYPYYSDMDNDSKLKPMDETIKEIINSLLIPPEPKKPTGLGWWRILLFFTFLIYGLSFYGCLLLSLDFLMQSLNLSKDILQSTSLVISIIRLCVTAIIFIAGTIILIVISIKVISRINASLKKENNFIEQREIWLKRYEIWCQLFYCGRDRKLFDPIKGDYCDPEDMTNYISEIYNNKYMSQNA